MYTVIIFRVNYWGNMHTGTYNNEYMVLDLKKIELNKAINDGALWVVEQIPGYALIQCQYTYQNFT